MAMWAFSFNMLPTLLGGINGALIMTLGGFSIMDGALTAGMFTAFQHLMGSFQAPVGALVSLGSTLQNTEMQMQRLNDVRSYEVDSLNFPADSSQRTYPKERLNGELTIKDLNFGYSPLEKPLLQNFNLHLKPGGCVAIVGASGSGKSTIAKIVTGLYQEWSGLIAFDGTDRRSLPRSVILNSVASFDQDIFLFSGTVADNISLFDTSIPRSDIISAAKAACIHDDILNLPGGYEAEIAEGGVNLSGGQRQRIEIARALAQKPSLLVLDEATAALDPITEKTLLKNIRQRGCSCLIVAHRLSAIRDCDEIIVLDRGQVVERGSHRELIHQNGFYKNMFNAFES